MTNKAGLWIDHKQALIVFLANDDVSTQTIESNLDMHLRGVRGSRSATPYGPQDVIAEDKMERKYQQHLSHYYDEVCKAIQEVDSVFVMGPGEAKGEFKTYLQKKGQKSAAEVAMETADKMTAPQVVAKVKQHFSH
ncbi:hypothetical protein KDN34_13935 [Shewanella yunxiaonensis]|uniref:Host attachment protein n=1 Tax=Shewanella yunxiaonensis TaxID=2829809 RepID=A0ABX7YSG7_9GAMM|nr:MULTISPECIES: hypothetical protein [Shewanella]MDF0535506.1 hypothetical protein [Shewanella sp. A32]QUN05284.1 hypothetical protein KDN34_13935 [Shewanella yunxiaonensis]